MQAPTIRNFLEVVQPENGEQLIGGLTEKPLYAARLSSELTD
jgi:hypothetical protein